MEENILICNASTADLIPMAELLAYLFTQEADFNPDANIQIKGLNQILDNAELGQLLVAKIDGKVVGMVNLLYTISTALGGKVAILEDMVVHPDWRDKGLGSILLKHAIDHAKSKNCLRITLLTDNDNIKAQKFYKKMGFEASSMMAMRLVF